MMEYSVLSGSLRLGPDPSCCLDDSHERRIQIISELLDELSSATSACTELTRGFYHYAHDEAAAGGCKLPSSGIPSVLFFHLLLGLGKSNSLVI